MTALFSTGAAAIVVPARLGNRGPLALVAGRWCRVESVNMPFLGFKA